MIDGAANQDGAPAKPAFSTRLATLLYGLGCLLVVLALLDSILAILAAVVFQGPVFALGILLTAFLSLAGGLCAIGLTSEVSSWLVSKSSLLSNSWVKRLVRALGIPIAFAALADARLMINSLTGGVDPEQFTFSLSVFTTVLTIWYVIQIWLVVTLILLFGSFFVLFFRVAFSSEGPTLREELSIAIGYLSRLRTGDFRLTYLESPFKEHLRNRIVYFGRMAGILGVLVILQYTTTARVPEYINNQIPKVITTVLVRSGYQPLSVECSNYKQDEWVSPLGYDKVSVATPDEEYGYEFETRSCNLNRGSS